jgi:hypothetical protein
MRILCFFFAIFAFSVLAQAAERPIVAVFDVEAQDVKISKKTLVKFTDYLQTSIVRCGFQSIPRSDIMNRIRNEQKESYKLCRDQSCQIELGRELSAQKVLSTKIQKIGTSCITNSNLYDLKKAAADSAASGESGCSPEELLSSIKSISIQICQPENTGHTQNHSKIMNFSEKLLRLQQNKRHLESIHKAWSMVQEVASYSGLPKEDRVKMVENFLSAYPEKNPHIEEARALLGQLQPAFILVETIPVASLVKVNGMSVGRAPAKVKVTRGSYTIEANELDHQQAIVQLNVTKGKTYMVKLTLKPLFGHVMVRSKPFAAQVSIGDHPPSSAPFRKKLKPGNYEIKASLEGHKSLTRKIEVIAGKEQKLELLLEKIPPARLVVETEPPGAIVKINGRPEGSTPLDKKLPPGKYSLKIEADDFIPQEKQLQLDAASSKTVRLTLQHKVPHNPYGLWSNITFWSGAGFQLLGGLAAFMYIDTQEAYKDGDFSKDGEIKSWSTICATSFALGSALMITSLVLFLYGPDDKQWEEEWRKNNLSLAPGLLPVDGGAVFGFSGSW